MTTSVSANSSQATDFLNLPLARMEAIVNRFEERVDASQRANPPAKELVKKAIGRKGAERCPVRLKRLSLDVIVRYGDALADLFCEFPDDAIFVYPYDIWIGYQPPDQKDRTNPVQVMMQAAEWTDEWGTRWGHAFGGVGATPVSHPIEDWSQLDDYLAHRIPDAGAPGRLDAALAVLAAHKETKFCVGQIHLALFERLHCLRGMENVFTDFYTNEREVRLLSEALTDYLIGMIQGWARIGADAVFLTDDWGSQTALMISPAMWRRFFKPYYRRAFDEAHRCGMDVIFHSCGNVMAIIPDLIDLGVDALDPIQPGAMDLDEVARRFGRHISFSGGIDVQHVLGSCTPEEIKDTVRRVVDTLARPFGNGLILAPANVITPEVPIENLRALFEACHGR